MAKQEEGGSEGESSQGSDPLQSRIDDKTTPHSEVKKKRDNKLKNGKASHPPGGRNGVEKKEPRKGVKKFDAKKGRKRKMIRRKERLKRKRKAKERGEGNQDEDCEQDSQEESGEDHLVVDFELIDPTDKYKDNVRILLRSTELYSNLKCTEELVSIICDQQNIGKFLCVVNGARDGEKEASFEDPADGTVDDTADGTEGDTAHGRGAPSNGIDHNMVGFQTIINLNQYGEIAPLKELLLQKVKKVNTPDYVESAKKITSLLSSNETKNIGLLIGHRILNTPMTLVPLIHKNIIEDVYWSQGIEDLDQSEKKFYFFDYLLFYTKIYNNAEGENIFANYEEEYFFRHKTDHVVWNNNNVKKFYEVVNGKNREVTYKECVTVFVVPFAKVDEALGQMQRGVAHVGGVSGVSGIRGISGGGASSAAGRG
ncbi:hypothetical protein C922_00020 [Plasmodium inui San Antonio 1]|uniref:Protein BCP1 n=1 Tax=Plasmodium inui San Antonio 1 TaxID=1237626 RepID=W7A7K5_9APIC|nr:hypothetical protein C922_00020 [Plasmodium inui San Antonio 1]EUD69157.1 hypothetical protein C922_00020 [Plasmodium inui San Antonio 1]